MSYEQEILDSRKVADIFQLVKKIVQEYLRADQAGLMVGVSDLGSHGRGFLGAFYSLNANMIIINKRPLARLEQTNPAIYNFYLFHILLHEYIHSIGSYDELQTRQLVQEISRHYFGADHVVTQMATDMERFLPHLTYPSVGFQPPEEMDIDFVMGLDRSNTNYIN
jgi:hypothetical protein